MSSLSVDEMREKRHSKNVPFIKFARTYSSENLNLLYCFFEGLEDKRYYSPRIENITNKESKVFSCNGKDKVIELLEFISKKIEYQKANLLYFVDKDYSRDRTIDNLYVTPCYSIENFYSDKYTIKKILINEFNLDENDTDFILSLELYEKLQKEFHTKLLIFNAWLSCQNDLREAKSKSTRLKIDGVLKSHFRNFNNVIKRGLNSIDDKLTILENQQNIESLYPNAEKIDSKKLEEKIALFKTLPYKCIFRGKFEISFLISFLNNLQDEINQKESSLFEKKCNCGFLFDINNAISNLSNYAYTPECLVKYLTQFR